MTGTPDPDRQEPSPDTSGVKGDALRLDSYVPFFINSISNKLTHGAARLYKQRFGIGVIEWRVLGFLAIDDGASAQAICQKLGIDKAAISRAVATLEDKRLIHLTSINGRQRALWMTAAGAAMHAQILPLALNREQALLSFLSEAERAQLIGLLGKLEGALARLDEAAGSDECGTE